MSFGGVDIDLTAFYQSLQRPKGRKSGHTLDSESLLHVREQTGTLTHKVLMPGRAGTLNSESTHTKRAGTLDLKSTHDRGSQYVDSI